MLDALLAAEELPQEYKDQDQVLCPCTESSIASFMFRSFPERSQLYANSNGVSRIYYAMIVIGRENLASTGSITNVASAVLITPG